MQQPPVALVITWGASMIAAKGGAERFARHFLREMKDDNNVWLNKCTNKPKHEVQYVYIIVGGKVRYRLLYAGWQPGIPTEINTTASQSFSTREWVWWPRIVLAGPVVLAPREIPMRGFQGFRYLTEPLY